ncbi:hypothetical protein DNK57_02600 [Methanothermobacter thermautotrophicus]|uniref:DUF2226 domain-containing protein n=1 Tax=Methanothermobacter thermautotrophicus TaxID=145262 RepID=A0A842YLG0_METTF|nr:DUF2226 domain-containing protein [Methanothermobacter thermautotrophicus]MBE2899718.1 hypothetical protein [Methanothermobacter thermautotrophicus]MCQ8905690.1 DUF2226 domain-containing protein [Methanothermobacter sp.]
MWLPFDNPRKMDYSVLKRASMPEFSYIRILDNENEAIIFVMEDKIVGVWHIDLNTLKETHSHKAMERIEINHDSVIEVYETDLDLFETLIELNDESKLSIPIDAEIIINEMFLDRSSREELLEMYRIRVPTDEAIESLIEDYKSR